MEETNGTTYPLNLLKSVNQHIRALNRLPDPKSIHRQSFASSMKAMRKNIPLIELSSPLPPDRLEGIRRALGSLEREEVAVIQRRFVEGLPFDPQAADAGQKLMTHALYRLCGEDLLPYLTLGEKGAAESLACKRQLLTARLSEGKRKGSYRDVPTDLLHLGPFVHNMLRFYQLTSLGDLLREMQDPQWADHFYGLSKYRKKIALCLLNLGVIGLNHPVFQKPRLRMLKEIPRADFPEELIYEVSQGIPSRYGETGEWSRLFVDLLESLHDHSDSYLIGKAEAEIIDRDIRDLIEQLRKLLETSPKTGRTVGETMLTILYYLSCEDSAYVLSWIRALCALLGYRPLYSEGGVCVFYPFEDAKNSLP